MKPKTQKEIESVLRLDGQARFEHFVKQVAAHEAAWGLWEDGWGLLADNEGLQVFPLWPSREYAELFRGSDWSEYEAKEISLEELLRDLLPGMAERGVLPGVFPTPAGQGVTPTAEELATALKIECEKYE